MHRSHTLTFVNAEVGGGNRTAVKVAGSRIAAVGEPPRAGEWILDLEGDRLLPGLINAHDHQQLNHLPRLELYAVTRTCAAGSPTSISCGGGKDR